MRRLLLSAALLAGVTVLLAGCGGSDSSSGTSAADWASGYCGDATTWVTSLDDARASVKTGTAPDEAAQSVTDETNSFIESINGLGDTGHPRRQHVGGDGEEPGEHPLRPGGADQRRSRHEQPRCDAWRSRRRSSSSRSTASLTDIKTTNAKLAQDDAELGTAMKRLERLHEPRRRARQGLGLARSRAGPGRAAPPGAVPPPRPPRGTAARGARRPRRRG